MCSHAQEEKEKINFNAVSIKIENPCLSGYRFIAEFLLKQRLGKYNTNVTYWVNHEDLSTIYAKGFIE